MTAPPRNRSIDALHDTPASPAPPFPTALAPIDWKSAGATAPTELTMGERHPDDPLPAADIVLITWTSAEWLALHHVFCDSTESQPISGSYAWRDTWLPYTRNSSGFHADPASGVLWGQFRMCQVLDRSGRPWRVLLFKSNSHLAHPPWIEGLSAMTDALLTDTGADVLYTIGTAGGATVSERLGDAVIANLGIVELQQSQNTADPTNGAAYRCGSWFPSTSMCDVVADHLLIPMASIADRASLEYLVGELRALHPDDPGAAAITLDDLLNDALDPASLTRPRILARRDAPVLTTDFYFIATGDDASAYAFLEMDDAVLGGRANALGRRWTAIRNISDPIVPHLDRAGAPIADRLRGDWSGLIYKSLGVFTSVNGAIAAWATIAGQGSSQYDPPRSGTAQAVPGAGPPPASPAPVDDPLEVKLVYDVRSCGSCDFFWPADKAHQPYGPYTTFDFDVDIPSAAAGSDRPEPQRWVSGRTRPPAFPNGEVIDGCRKAPIMTIGINPNLTAFAPGSTGAAWAYPDFGSDDGTDAWTKYAWYYRYRTVYQERVDSELVKRFVLDGGRVHAPRPGRVVGAIRSTDSPAWSFTVRYDGDATDTEIALPGTVGDFPYVLLVDPHPPADRFDAGDLLAGRLAIPAGIEIDVLQQEQGYYTQFLPVLARFEQTLQAAGHDVALAVGEDVAQIDMVACASPHWNAGFLGGSADSIATIVSNCVTDHAWAMKQLVQTRPAVLYIVSTSSWNMFHANFGAHVIRDVPLSSHPVDHDFTLLRETTDPDHPAYLDLDVTVDGQRYQLRTRLVITPHFSYSSNFVPQLRIERSTWDQLRRDQLACIEALERDEHVAIVLPSSTYPDDRVVVTLGGTADDVAAVLAMLRTTYPDVWATVQADFYDPHASMASVLDDLYAHGQLTTAVHSSTGHAPWAGREYLTRTEGSCHFCDNRHWSFPNECRYGKTSEAPVAASFLEAVVAQVIATGAPTDAKPAHAFELAGVPVFVAETRPATAADPAKPRPAVSPPTTTPLARP